MLNNLVGFLKKFQILRTWEFAVRIHGKVNFSHREKKFEKLRSYTFLLVNLIGFFYHQTIVANSRNAWKFVSVDRTITVFFTGLSIIIIILLELETIQCVFDESMYLIWNWLLKREFGYETNLINWSSREQWIYCCEKNGLSLMETLCHYLYCWVIS